MVSGKSFGFGFVQILGIVTHCLLCSVRYNDADCDYDCDSESTSLEDVVSRIGQFVALSFALVPTFSCCDDDDALDDDGDDDDDNWMAMMMKIGRPLFFVGMMITSG